MKHTFLRWAGGKNWFVKTCNEYLPTNYNRYIEPFLGSGAVFFYMEPQKAILSDINAELIKTYQAIQTDWKEVEKKLQNHAKKHDKEYYYKIRSQKPRIAASIAARMIYLNRTCFNGIYRVNKKNEFNVPKGLNDSVLLPEDDFSKYAAALQAADLRVCDFEKTIDEACDNDFLFVDPPYAVQEGQSFVGYTKSLFNWNDQVRLAEALKRAQKRHAKILVTNVNHISVRKLYEEMPGFNITVQTRFSSISGKQEGRKQYQELIISSNLEV